MRGLCGSGINPESHAKPHRRTRIAHRWRRGNTRAGQGTEALSAWSKKGPLGALIITRNSPSPLSAPHLIPDRKPQDIILLYDTRPMQSGAGGTAPPSNSCRPAAPARSGDAVNPSECSTAEPIFTLETWGWVHMSRGLTAGLQAAN